jgi:anti-sigma regulatory factor (Ser/Thr protein kinase)
MRTETRHVEEEAGGFRHEALFYDGFPDFVARTGTLIREAVRRGEPTLVLVSQEKIDALLDVLDGAARDVRFEDMAEVGGNPARLIPAWRAFVEERTRSGNRLLGVGEPVWVGRTADELVECARHEALLNLAFSGAEWRLTCPYDEASLPRTVLDEARRNHPFLVRDGSHGLSARYRGLEDALRPFDEPLPPPGGPVHELRFGPSMSSLGAVRALVARLAAAAGLDPSRRDDLVLVVNEAATNSIRHGGGTGAVAVWEDGDTIVCDVRDAGRIADPLVGRVRPAPGQGSGLGLWLANQLCDLVQIRPFPTGSVVRLRVAR